MVERDSRPWYTDMLREQKQTMRNAESKWVKYKMEHQMTAYKSEKIKYVKLLYVMKRDYLKTQFHDHEGNSKLIHIGGKVGRRCHPMLDSNLDVEVANDFANLEQNS